MRLFEWRGCLRGVWTAGLLGYLLDFDKTGVTVQLHTRVAAIAATTGRLPHEVTWREAEAVIHREVPRIVP